MRICLNGESRELDSVKTAGDLLRAFDLDPKATAVEINREIIERGEYDRRELEDGDRVELVRFLGGG
jgi:sulfur carrier protein